MNYSILIHSGRENSCPTPKRRRGLAPEILLQEGILRDPSQPKQAWLRARSLYRYGHFKEARTLILPHLNKVEPELKIKMTELLAKCAMKTGGNWEAPLKKVLADYQQRQNTTKVAQTHAELAKMYMLIGRLQDADIEAKKATSLFKQRNNTLSLGLMHVLRACIRKQAGMVNQARKRIDYAVEKLTSQHHSPSMARARLHRAHILALQGEHTASAKDLLYAENVLGRSGNAIDRIRTRIIRAECLYLNKQWKRAATGLKRILVDLVELEDTSLRAWVHKLLGQAYIHINPAIARKYLIRSRYLYTTLGYDFFVSQCDIALAKVEYVLGLNANGRLNESAKNPLKRSPLLATYFNLARAEINHAKDPVRAHRVILRVRQFALKNGNKHLVAKAEAVLARLAYPLTETSHEFHALKKISTQLPIVHCGSVAMPCVIKQKQRPAPQPFSISDVSSLNEPSLPHTNNLKSFIRNRLNLPRMLEPATRHALKAEPSYT